MKIGALDEVETWTGGGGMYLGVGDHDVKCISEVQGTSSGGHPQIELEWEGLSGDDKGSTIKSWVVITANSLGRVKQLMEACGVDIPKGEFELKENSFPGLCCRIIVRKKNPDDKYPQITAYTPMSDIPGDTDFSSEQSAKDAALPF